MFARLPSDHKETIFSYLTNAARSHKNRQNEWVRNLSSRVLSVHKQKVLSKVLNFAISSDNALLIDNNLATEQALWSLDQEIADVLRSYVTGLLKNVRLPSPNLTKEERQSIKDLLKQ